MRLFILLFLGCLLVFVVGIVWVDVFINELYYDDSIFVGDVGEVIEVVVIVGENLVDYWLYLYNGSILLVVMVYVNNLVLVGIVVGCGSVILVMVIYFSNGLQNGVNDGIVLVDVSGKVVQFISYEGIIIVFGGLVVGLISQNILVSEINSIVFGIFLQFIGSGSQYVYFIWVVLVMQIFGVCNNGQIFSGGGSIGLNILLLVCVIMLEQGVSIFLVVVDFSVMFSELVILVSGVFVFSCGQFGIVLLSYVSSGLCFMLFINMVLVVGEVCCFDICVICIIDVQGVCLVVDICIVFIVVIMIGNFDLGNLDFGMLGMYYLWVNIFILSQLCCLLYEIIKGYIVYLYSGLGISIWIILEIVDEDFNNSGRILDVYCNCSYIKVSGCVGMGSGLIYNCEYIWFNLFGFVSIIGDKGLLYVFYIDIYMLYLIDVQWNVDCGNKLFGKCDSSCGECVIEFNNGFGGGSGGYLGNFNWVCIFDGNGGIFEVWGYCKGDMVWVVMYMVICYEGGKDVKIGQFELDLELIDDCSRIVKIFVLLVYMGLFLILIDWYLFDLLDVVECVCNEVIYSFQGNCNFFIDYFEWVILVLFILVRLVICQLVN